MLTLAESVVFTGVSGCFGGAPTPRAFWKALLKKQAFFKPLVEPEAVGHLPEALLPDTPLPEVCSALGEHFAIQADHIPLPPDVGIGDNTDFWFAAQLIYDALADAGIPTGAHSDRMALFVGYEPAFNPAEVNWFWHAQALGQLVDTVQRFFPTADYARMEAVRSALLETLPRLKRRHVELSRGEGVVRALAQAFGACDTACLCAAGESSVFAGLEAASNALRLNQCDVAIVVALQPPFAQAQLAGEAVLTPFSTAHALAPFTSSSAGTLPGEGGAAFVLRRLGEVQQNGSPHIYAKLHGCAQISGLSPQAPGGLEESLRRALHRALRRLPNGFRDIDYWEMNASGIPEEDLAEENLLNRVTLNRGAHIPLLALGSAKTSFGNTFTAAGALGLLKGLLAVSHKVLPPSVTPVDESFRLQKPEQAYYWVQEARPWIASSMRPRRLAVSTLSCSGRTGAAVLEEVER